MTEAKSIKNLKEAVALVLAGAKVVGAARADGAINVADAGLLLNLIPVMGPAIEDIGQVPAELADLSAEEAAELCTFIMASQAVESEKAKALIQGAFRVLAGAVQIIGAFKAPAAPAQA